MPWLLRKVHKSYWNHDSLPRWLKPGEAPAVLLREVEVPKPRPAAPSSPYGLQDETNVLSVWSVEDDRSNLDSVIVALASNALPAAFDYVLVRQEVVQALDIRVDTSPGDSAYDAANAVWHRDLSELTAAKLAALTTAMLYADAPATRVSEPRVLGLLASARARGALNVSRMNATLVAKMDALQSRGGR